MSHISRWPAILLCFFSLGLGSKQIALIVNRNDAAGMKLALAYTEARGIPQGNTIMLDLPDSPEISFDQYENDVVPAIRQFLTSHLLADQVTCLVTFYGVPYRIRDRENTLLEDAELNELRSRLPIVNAHNRPLVEEEEALAEQLDPAFRRPPLQEGQSETQSLVRRSLAAENAAGIKIDAIADAPAKHLYFQKLIKLMAQLGGPAEVLAHLSPIPPGDPRYAARQEQMAALQQVVHAIGQLQANRQDAGARGELRKLIPQVYGPLKESQILETQIDYLTPGLSNSALDNELALLWLDEYPRQSFFINPLNYKISRFPGKALMVARLDGPNPDVVYKMIQTSVRVEQTGLSGAMAINSFGYPTHLDPAGHNEYRAFDHVLRNLAMYVRAHTSVPVDEQYTRLFKDRELHDVALYCGWYSLRNYVPGMRFSDGAVGYHVASLEMVGLHEPGESGWVRGLLSDGVTATVGPVAEPYLGAFPPPQEFFPLLMTGKLTLAEVYWKTEPWSSWMMCLIGDPLYTPYKINPPLKVEDLPPRLAAVVRKVEEQDLSENTDSSLQTR